MNPKIIKKTFFILLLTSFYGKAQSTQKLWYKQPAEFFEESLVLGNGKMGATVFGGANSDKIYLNDITLWSGEPVNANMNPNAYKHLPDVREALADNNYKKAQTLIKKLFFN